MRWNNPKGSEIGTDTTIGTTASPVGARRSRHARATCRAPMATRRHVAVCRVASRSAASGKLTKATTLAAPCTTPDAVTWTWQWQVGNATAAATARSSARPNR